MANIRIKPVENNVEKQRVYRNQMEKYNRAMQFEFYYEAIMIDYAMIEDRLRSMLYHMGFLANRRATGIWKRNRPILLNMVTRYKREDENLSLGINALNGKIKIIRSVFCWANQTEHDYKGNRYLTALKSQIESTDVGLLLETLDQIDAWKSTRNEIVHALMNKNIDALEDRLKPIAEEGMCLARVLDGQVKILKSGNKIRKSLNLPINQ